MALAATIAVLVLCVARSAVLAAFSTDQASQFATRLAALDARLIGTADIAVPLVGDPTDPSGAGTCTRSLPACGPSRGSLGSYTVNFSTPVPSDVDFVQTKAFVEPTAAGTAAHAAMCRAQGLRPEWRSRLQGASGDLYFQYFADAATQGIAVYPPLPWNCSRRYVPRERPWYTAASTGQKDVVVLIDTSDVGIGGSAGAAALTAAARVESAVATASALLRSLSFRDYFAVVPFSSYARTSLTPVLLQATAANVNSVVARMSSLVAEAGRRPSLAAGLRAAAQVLRVSEANSGCSQLIVALTPGFDDTPLRDPLAELSDAQRAAPVAVLGLAPGGVAGSPATAHEAPQALRRLACRTGGVVGLVRVGREVDDAQQVNAYLARLRGAASTIRWSEVYEDAFGQGRVITGAWATYDSTSGALRGLVAADVPLAGVSLSGSLSENDVTQLLLRQGRCRPLEQLGANTAAVEALQGGLCSGISDGSLSDGERETPTVRKLKPLWIIISVLLILALFLAPLPIELDLYYVRKCEFWMFFKIGAPWYLVAGIALAFWIGFLVTFWTEVGDGAIDRDVLDSVTYRTIRLEENPYRCCVVTDCRCLEYGRSTSCAALVANLSEGECGFGYRCCERYHHSCDIPREGQRRECNGNRCSCTSCRRSVANDVCRSQCGTCTAPTATVTYTYKDTHYEVPVTTDCSMGHRRCVDDHLGQFPLGAEQKGYVDPEDPHDLRLGLPPMDVGNCVLLGVFGLVFRVMTLALLACCHAMGCRH